MAKKKPGATARPAAKVAKATPRVQEPPRPRVVWWKSTLLILLGICILGIVPIGLAGQLLGMWQLPIPKYLPVPVPKIQPSPTTSMSGYALMRGVRTANRVDVLLVLA